MRNVKVLEMINQGRIEELKDLLRDEIYQDVLKKKPGAKQRYAAMKKYFGYVRTARTCCEKPAMIEFDGKSVTSFCNSYSLALTTEPCGAIELFTDDDGDKVDIYSGETKFSPIVIENDIGVCLVLPMKCDEEFIKENNITVIELKKE